MKLTYTDDTTVEVKSAAEAIRFCSARYEKKFIGVISASPDDDGIYIIDSVEKWNIYGFVI
jgi:hypothetical protein